MSLVRRRLDFAFTLGSASGTFGGSSDTVTLTGLRASATIHRAGISAAELNARIYGISLPVMNKLTVLGKYLPQSSFNQITVSAGDADAGVAACFTGILVQAWVDMENAPDVSFVIAAQANVDDAMRPVPPTSYNGYVDVVTVLNGICAQMNPPRKLENSGVSKQMPFPYLHGTLWYQLQQVQQQADINMVIDDVSNVVAIWPSGGSRNGAIKLVSKDTGMVGYPSYTQNGIQATTLFDSAISTGRQVQIDSILTPAAGVWTVFEATHDLESETPNGKWFTTFGCAVDASKLPVTRG